MVIEDNLLRVESAVSATASGNLTWGLWALDCAIALGISGRRNPLGFVMVRYLSDTPSVMNARAVILALAKQMQKRGVADDGINEMAFKAFEFWQNNRCSACKGRGVVGREGSKCQPCGGSGKKKMPVGPDPVRIGISCLIEHEEWLEGQLRARLKGLSSAPVGDGYRVNLPSSATAINLDVNGALGVGLHGRLDGGG